MDWKIHRAILIAAIWIAEVLSAGICGFIAALALIPASYAARGYFAFGGEWLIVLGVTLLAFHVINNAFFKIRAINEGYHTHTVALDKKGNPYINGGNVVFRDERDNAKATRHILVEALQYPKLDDPELMKYYNCVDITQMPEKVFSRADEFAHVTRVVMALLGIGGQLSEEEQKQADEKEIDDAKN